MSQSKRALLSFHMNGGLGQKNEDKFPRGAMLFADFTLNPSAVVRIGARLKRATMYGGSGLF